MSGTEIDNGPVGIIIIQEYIHMELSPDWLLIKMEGKDVAVWTCKVNISVARMCGGASTDARFEEYTRKGIVGSGSRSPNLCTNRCGGVDFSYAIRHQRIIKDH